MLKAYLRKADISIYVVCTIIAFGSMFSINYLDLTDEQSIADLKMLGFVVDQRNVTKRKQTDSLAWRKVYNNNSLFKGDKVFTEEASLATLGVGKKSKIDLSELTLMKIDESKDGKMNFDFMDGFFVARVDQDDDIEKVTVGDTVLVPLLGLGTAAALAATTGGGSRGTTGGAGPRGGASKSSQFQVSKSGLNTGIAVASGSLMLDHNGKKAQLGKNQFVNLEKGKDDFVVQTAMFKLIAPDMNEKNYLSTKSLVNFRWINLENISQNGVKLLISKDQNFRKVLFEQEISTSFIDIDRAWEGGEYFWKITGPDQEKPGKIKDLSFTQKFYVFILGSPTVTQPTLDEVLYLKEKEKFNISWSSNEAELYEYKVLLNSNGEMITVKTDKTKENLVTLETAMFGQYLFQVRAIRGLVTTEWSKPHSFKIKKKANAFEPALQFPDNEAVHIITEEPIHFKWHGTDDAEYFIEVAKDNQFQEKIFTKSSYEKSFKFTPQEEHSLFWRVIRKRDEPVTKYRVVHARHLPPNVIKPTQKTFITNTNLFDVEVEWDTNVDSEFVVEFAEDSAFENIIETTKTRTKSIKVPLEADKKYFIRVYRANSQAISEIKEIDIKRVKRLKTPKIKSNLKFKLKQTYIPKEVGPYTIYFSPLLASRSRNISSYSSYIDLRWDKMEGAKEYEIEVFSDPGGEDIIAQEKIKKNFYRWGNPTLGTYYWRIRYFDQYGQKSDFSNISKIVIEKEMIKKVRVREIPYFAQISPKHRSEFQEKRVVPLKWAKVKGAVKYRLLLYTDFDANKIFKKIPTKAQSANIKFPAGEYYWKVEAFDSNGKIIGKTRARKIIANQKRVAPLVEIAQKPKKKERRHPFLDRKKNPNINSFVLGGVKPGTYDLTTDLVGSLATSSDNLIMLSSFDIYGGLNYSEDLFFEGFYDFKSAGNNDLTIFDHTYGAVAYKYFVSEKGKNILYGLGARHSIFNVEMQQTNTDSSINLNYFNAFGKILVDLPWLIFDQRISLEAGFGPLAPTSYYWQLSYHAKYYYFKKMGITPLQEIFFYFGGEYFSRSINYQNSTIEIQNLLAVGGVGIDVEI